MAFCKVCPCGNKIVFETRLGFPEQCSECGRRIRDFLTYQEDDPQVEGLLRQFSGAGQEKEQQAQEPTLAPEQPPCEEEPRPLVNGVLAYVLAPADQSYEIIIPPEGGVVGRGGIGAAQLAGNSAISREHLRITPRRNGSVIIQDVSTYGTKLNGIPMVPNTPTKAELNFKITLYDEELILLEKEVECIDSV